MKRRARSVILLALVIVFLVAASGHASADDGKTIVYRTKTGECYHRENCSYLRSSIPITLEVAVAYGLRPCSRCKPPTLDEPTKSAPATTAAPAPEAAPVEKNEYEIMLENWRRSHGKDSGAANVVEEPVKTIAPVQETKPASGWDSPVGYTVKGAAGGALFSSLFWRLKIRRTKHEHNT